MMRRFSAWVLFGFAPLLCGSLKAQTVHLGIDILQENKFRQIEGKRVGLLTHPAGVNRNGQSTIDILRRAPNARLVALFGPEHGIYGDEKANQPIANKSIHEQDNKTTSFTENTDAQLNSCWSNSMRWSSTFKTSAFVPTPMSVA